MKWRFSLVAVLPSLFVACSDGENTQGGAAVGGSGGIISSGGTSHTGGTTASDGTTSAGGATASGGATSSTAAKAMGGTSDSSGRPDSSGGRSDSGGASGSATVTGTGGATRRGGSTAKGGTNDSGSFAGAGGTTANRGGSTGSGGAAGNNKSTSTTGCTREMLQSAVDSFLAALKTGDTSGMSLTSSAKYIENGATVALNSGLWATPLTPDLTMSLLDVTACGSYTEIIAASASHPYVLGGRLAVEASTGQISAITTIVTDCDDWGFNAATYLKEAKAEQGNKAAGSGWGPVDPSDQYSREELLAGGKAYFAYWGDKTVAVPWGDPCCRTEGGMVTNPDPNPRKGTPDQTTCKVGIPDQNMPPKVSDQLADVDYGMVVDFLNMPGPDSHWLRFTKSTDMRYIHTLTVCYVNGKWQCPGTQPTCK